MDIVSVLESYQADVITLQEYRHSKNHRNFMQALADMGYQSVLAPPTANARDNSILLASKLALSGDEFPDRNSSPCRALKAELVVSDATHVNLVCVHLPHKKAQIPFFEALHRLPAGWLEEKSALLGDFNCGIPFIDSETRSFYATHLFQQLLSDGWVDAWRSRNPDEREYTWYSTQRANGFRYDHALVSEQLDQSVADIRYDHSVRVRKLSDHSLMILDLDL